MSGSGSLPIIIA